MEGRVFRRSLIISAGSLTLAACAGASDRHLAPALDAPAQFAATPAHLDGASARAESDWVISLGDDALPALIAEALDANPNIAGARAGLDAALAAARVAGAARLPSLDAGIGVSAQDNPIGPNTVYTAGLDAGWQPDLWGRLSDQARAGAAQADAAEADLYGARLTIAAATASSWFGLTEARLQTELAQRDVDTRARQLDIVERRFARGVARSSDVRTARSALASARASLSARINIERASARALETLLGRYPAAETAPADTLPDLGALPYPGDPAALLARRPDIAAAERRLAAAGFSADAARKAIYPALNLSASIGSQATDFSDLFSSAALAETLSASLIAPIFRGGQLRAQRDQAEALARIEAAGYIATVLNALEEAETAIYADQRLAEQVEALDVAQAEAEAALALVERQYASGVATIFELIDAQSRLIQAEAQLIGARRNRLDNRIALHLAIAGDFAAGGGVTGGGALREL